MIPYSIITHPGQAHADDFIACSLVLASEPSISRVERREPTQDDLDNPEAYVIDVGSKHQPELLNFDHHNVPGLEDQCSIDLVLEHFSLTAVANDASKWVGFKSAIDCHGPYRTATLLGVSNDIMAMTLSPVERFVIDEFAQCDLISPTKYPATLASMRAFGDYWISYWKSYATAMTTLNKVAKVLTIEGPAITYRVVDFRGYPGKLNTSVASRFLDANYAVGSISRETRGPEPHRRVSLFRHADHRGVDFRRIPYGDMHFVHHNGFVAKSWEDPTDEQIIAWWRMALGIDKPVSVFATPMT